MKKKTMIFTSVDMNIWSEFLYVLDLLCELSTFQTQNSLKSIKVVLFLFIWLNRLETA